MMGTKNEEEECTQCMTHYLYCSQDTCVTENGYNCVPCFESLTFPWEVRQ